MQRLTEIKNRIKSVSDTRKITGAMEMISVAKARKAAEKADANLPFFEKYFDAVKKAASAGDAAETKYCAPAPASAKTLYIAVAGSKGLAGGFNVNVLKQAYSAVTEAPEKRVLFTVGYEARDFFAHKGIVPDADFSESMANVTVKNARLISDAAHELFVGGGAGRVTVFYTRHSGKAAEVAEVSLLPVAPDRKTPYPAEFDSSAKDLLDALIPEYLCWAVYGMLLQSEAAEHQARRAAMNNAGRNAAELLDGLTLTFHRARQESVTTELTEIVATGSGVRGS